MLQFTAQETQMIIDSLSYYEEVCEEALEYSVGSDAQENAADLEIIRGLLNRLGGERSSSAHVYHVGY